MAEKLTLLDTEKITSDWASVVKNAILSCPKIKKQREIEILFDRFGIGKKAKTLNAIGLKHGLTRERIRQIIANTIRKVQKNCLDDHLNKKIHAIEEAVGQAGGFLTLDDLARNFRLGEDTDKNALHLTASFSTKLNQFKESQTQRVGWHNKNVKPSDVKAIGKEGSDFIKKSGKVESTAKVAQKLNRNENLTRFVLSATKAVMETGSDKWGLVSWPHINPKSIRDKSRYILKKHGKPMHYSDLTEKIKTINNKEVTKQSVHNELIKNVDFVLIGRGIYALSEWGYAPGIVEDVIAIVLEEAGEPLHKKIIIERVMERRLVKESTIVLNLQKNRFKRVAKAVYTLN